MHHIDRLITDMAFMSLFVNNPVISTIITLIILGLIIASVVMYFRKKNSNTTTTTTTVPPMQTQIPALSKDINKVTEQFAAISADDYKKFMDATKTADGLTSQQKSDALAALGCQNAIDMNMQGYRSAASGATFKIEEVQKTGVAGYPKYIVHAAESLVIAVDPNTARLSRVIKNTNSDEQLFNKELADGKTATGAVMFTKTLASGVKFALQYEHEALSLRPLDASVTPPRPWLGQQFFIDVNLKGKLLDAAAFSLGYKLSPGLGPLDLQNIGIASVNGGAGSSVLPVATAAASGDLGALTKAQLDSALAAAVANINAFNRTSGGSQPGTQDNPFANKPLKINLNLSGLAGPSNAGSANPMEGLAGPSNAGSANPMEGLVSGFADVHKTGAEGGSCGMRTEVFTDMTGNSGTSQIRSLIQAWDAAQNPGAENDFGGMPIGADALGNALRGKMLSCPKLDRTQYYTERQLSQCAGCTPDPYLRGQLGGQVYS
jgi:hypothetical protein